MFLLAGTVHGQQPARPCPDTVAVRPADIGDAVSDFARIAELAQRAPLRSHLFRRLSSQPVVELCRSGGMLPWATRPSPVALAADGLQVELLPVHGLFYVNQNYASDRNNGALWTGRGPSAQVGTGVALRWGPVSAAFAPRIAYQRNGDFATLPTGIQGFSPYVHRWHGRRIDWPQRFGPEPFWTADPGQSYVRIDAWGAALGVSTENLWWGPARRYPILLSNTAPGFPHVFLGTSRPVDVWIGHLAGEMLWGRLSESDYFDDNPANDHRLFAGLVLAFEPRGLPGLSLGFARSFLTYTRGYDVLDYVFEPYTDVRNNTRGPDNPLGDNQLLSLFLRWALPESGFEVYGEWAREDHWEDFEDLISEPDHSQAYMLGLQKVLTRDGYWLRIYGELAHLGTSTTVRSGRPGVTFYTHSQVKQGYTQRGQLLGAWIGPGSDAQAIGADLFRHWGSVGLLVERVRYDADTFYDAWARYYAFHGHDVELTAAVRQLLFLGPVDLSWQLGYSFRRNRNYIGLDGVTWDFQSEANWSLELGLTWYPDIVLPGTRTAAAAR